MDPLHTGLVPKQREHSLIASRCHDKKFREWAHQVVYLSNLRDSRRRYAFNEPILLIQKIKIKYARSYKASFIIHTGRFPTFSTFFCIKYYLTLAQRLKSRRVRNVENNKIRALREPKYRQRSFYCLLNQCDQQFTLRQ